MVVNLVDLNVLIRFVVLFLDYFKRCLVEIIYFNLSLYLCLLNEISMNKDGYSYGSKEIKYCKIVVFVLNNIFCLLRDFMFVVWFDDIN